MKYVSIVGKPFFLLALAVVAIGLGTARAESNMSEKVASGSAPGGSTDQGFSNNKPDEGTTGSGAKRGSGSASEIGSPPGTEKSLGSSKPGSSGMKSGTASGSGSGGNSGSDRGTSGTGSSGAGK